MTQEQPQPQPPDLLQRLTRRLERERAARKEAERLLEEKAVELYRSNTALRQLADSLEQEVAATVAREGDVDDELRYLAGLLVA